MDAKIQHIVTAYLAPETVGKPGGLAVAVYAAGHTEFFNYGVADEATRQPITSDTLFNVASVRKPFEAILLALGTLRGELRLDDPVSRYVPELRGDYIKRVTIGELATHTSGLLLPTDHPPWPNDSFNLPQFFEALNAWTPPSGEQPGKQRIYTHAGYVLLQLALERRYGQPIGDLIEANILKPLGMNQTFLPERGPDHRAMMAPELMERVVQGYSDTGMAIGPPGDQQTYYDFPRTGQMFTSARDLATFLAAFIDGEAIDPQLRQALQMTQREAFHVTEKFGQAMAWENIHLNDVTVVDKPGGLNNASAYLGLVPAHKVGIVLLANRGEFPHEIARYHVLPELARE
ncbi:serine hydrolase [Bradyrhizobium sp. AUGA SZCCT0160]|uniref:serine hydrolase n=1 Tax=Bradyrhizobium sp. AUGA SZCCT0160 TaxID=2807662 RepID=UPI001BAC82AD|nr:serine hydrolase [Bradyrhizobium sp. AUGA SZCCT0160]MBR1192812.1 serine hydrolase [Bradyrhizobium sp. AUGA SZCCT0160]